MGIFVVFHVKDPAKIRAAIAAKFPNDHLDLGDNEWLVSSKGTARTVSDEIGITGSAPSAGSAIVISMQGYYGRAATNIWDWVKAKAEATDG
jgi:hypothetical protein